jgi:hypothetical protein
MKYISFGYFDENKWEAMSESEQQAFVDECFAYDDRCGRTVTLSAGKRSKALGMPSRCDGKAAGCPLPTVRMPRPRNSWADSVCSKAEI